MGTYNIWSEGYCATGESSLHFLLGTSKGNSFKEAVINWVNNGSDRKKFFNENKLTFWGM